MPSYTAEDESASYLESLSDLLVGMLFIFIIILMIFALSYRVAQDRSDQDHKTLTQAAAKRAFMLKNLRNELGSMVEIDPKTGVLRMPETLLFDAGSADLKPQGYQTLAKLGQLLNKDLPCYTRVAFPSYCPQDESGPILDTVMIEGHTDVTPIHTAEFSNNYNLGAERAYNTMMTLLAQAPGLQSLTNDHGERLLSISSYGETRPVTKEPADISQRPAWLRMNRRIDIRFLIGTPSEVTTDAGGLSIHK
jgi:flagellar motor protein MotB